MNLVMLSNAGLWAGMSLTLALPGLLKPGARKWVAVVFIVSLIDGTATGLSFIIPKLDFLGGHWNWTGKLYSLVALLAISAVLIGQGHFKAREIGLTAKQAPGTACAMAMVVLPYFLLLIILTATVFGNSKPPTPETLAFEGTMPGMAEELSIRGVQLALFDRIFTGRFRLLGAEMGYGAVALSVVFGLLHGLAFDKHLTLQFSVVTTLLTGTIGFILVWVRARTQSLVMPVIVHNVTNLIGASVPLLT